jgi:hypothetical protein
MEVYVPAVQFLAVSTTLLILEARTKGISSLVTRDEYRWNAVLPDSKDLPE